MPNLKVEHVLRQGQTREHHCHWPGCDKQVPPARWGCRAHWYALPVELRNRIWATYRVGQEVNATPSRAYVEVARAAQSWIAQYLQAQSPMPLGPLQPAGSTADQGSQDQAPDSSAQQSLF